MRGYIGIGVLMERFEVYKDSLGKLRFNLRAKNGKILAISEPYDSIEACKADIGKIQDGAMSCKIVEVDL